ncbi:uncharacterized protein [Solanum lycopersicum]|uniref:uncharacterized protein n=1 Tax=Solanum lycopersicum TaxID=4081 RepID=UPI00374802EC
MSQGVDYSHPMFLSPTDISGLSLISFQLVGIENYALWSRSIKLALLGRNKIGLIDGSCTKEDASAELGSQVRSLYQYIFTKLKTLWDEFEALVPPPGCDCEKARGFFDYLKRHKLYKFLMGLNELFEKARSEILLMSHVPTVNQAYTMVVNDECQKVTSSRYKGHNKDQCYKLIGYPSDFKSKRKVSTNTRSGAYMVETEVNSTRKNGYEDGLDGSNFNYISAILRN